MRCRRTACSTRGCPRRWSSSPASTSSCGRGALVAEELYLKSHADVVRAVLDGHADVGATYAIRPPAGQPIRRAAFVDVAPARPARVLEWTVEIPNDAICGHGLLGKQEHRVFSNAVPALCERDDGRRRLFDAFHAERFVATPRNAFKSRWALVERPASARAPVITRTARSSRTSRSPRRGRRAP